MSDNDIKKALECCIADNASRCGECAYIGIVGCCFKKMMPDALDLINRQQAEIERLQKDNEYILMQHKFDRRPNGDCWNDVIEKAKSEAIKDFAERLNKHSVYVDDYDCFMVSTESIDNLVKEMTEGV